MSPSDKSGIWASRDNYSYGGSQPQANIRVLIVDDHAGYRHGLRAMLELEDSIEVMAEASDGREALEQLQTLKPDVVLMDVNMPGADGLEVTRSISRLYPDLFVIILTMFTGEEYLREARRAGASAYVLKDASSDTLVHTIRDVMSGEVPILQGESQSQNRSHATGPLKSLPPTSEGVERPDRSMVRLLSGNERAILKLLAAGSANAQVAHEMGISESMVGTYLAEIYRKLHLPGREAAIGFAQSINDEF